MCLSSLSILSVPDEGYARNLSCALNEISTFSLSIPLLVDYSLSPSPSVLSAQSKVFLHWHGLIYIFNIEIYNSYLMYLLSKLRFPSSSIGDHIRLSLSC